MAPHVRFQIIFRIPITFEQSQRFQNCTRELFQVAWVIDQERRILKNTKFMWFDYCSIWQLTFRVSSPTAALIKMLLSEHYFWLIKPREISRYSQAWLNFIKLNSSLIERLSLIDFGNRTRHNIEVEVGIYSIKSESHIYRKCVRFLLNASLL